jgi:hypothetical protein
MKEVNCCCRSVDAHRCVVLRHPELVKDWTAELLNDCSGQDDDDRCECCCHQSEEEEDEEDWELTVEEFESE